MTDRSCDQLTALPGARLATEARLVYVRFGWLPAQSPVGSYSPDGSYLFECANLLSNNPNPT
jgi:hypothetical protein